MHEPGGFGRTGCFVAKEVCLSVRGALPFLATLQASAERQLTALLIEAGGAAPTWRGLARRGGPHTLPTRLTLATELLPSPGGVSRRRLLAAAESLASELKDAIGDGVLLHPAYPRTAPRHGRTVGRPWLLTPSAVFNLAGVPVTEVPLGLTPRGLPGRSACRWLRRPGTTTSRSRSRSSSNAHSVDGSHRRSPGDDRDGPLARSDGDPHDGDRARPGSARAARIPEPRARQ